jgi:heme-degrading monooxygenase HmoA
MFVHLVVHHPKPEHSDDLLASMQRVNATAQDAPGLIQIGTWRDQRSDGLIGLAVWESQEAFQASAERIFEAVADDPFDQWEQRPPDVFHLTKP